MNYVVIFAGGVGSRMGNPTPKQFLKVDNKPIIIHVVEKFSNHPLIDGIVVVSKEEYINYCRELSEEYHTVKVLDVVAGGKNGQESIYNGVNAIYQNFSKNPKEDIVLIHDGVRPVITEQLITDSIRSVLKYGNSIAVSKAIETVIRVDEEGTVVDTVDRSECRNAKAPQCFILEDLWQTHQRAIKEGVLDTIDSATLMSRYGVTLHTVECEPENIKITTPNDYYMFQALYHAGGQAKDNS